MRKQVLIITIVALAILPAATLQDVMAQEALLDSPISLSPESESTQWSFSFNQGDELTGVLSCIAGTLDLIILLDDATAMHRQRVWEGQSVPLSWVIPAIGTWNVSVTIAQHSSCIGHIKLNVKRASGTSFGLPPIGWIMLLEVVALIAVAIVGVIRARKAKKPTGDAESRLR